MINHNLSPRRRLRVLFSDHLGLARGKYISHEPAKNSLLKSIFTKNLARSGHTRFCQGIFELTLQKSLSDAPHAGFEQGFPDIEARYYESDIHAGWENNTHCVVSDLYNNQGTPLNLCGRGALKRAVAEWQKLGMTPQFGVELEGYIFVRDANGQLHPFDLPRRILLWHRHRP